MYDKDKFLNIISMYKDFKLCGPSDDPDIQTSVVYSLKDLVKKCKFNSKHINDIALRDKLQALDDRIETIYEAFDLYSDLGNIIGELEDYFNSPSNVHEGENLNPLERLDVIESIACRLQEEMTTSDINVLLKGYDVDFNPCEGVSSKRIYVKEILSDISNESILLRIAEDIGLKEKISFVSDKELSNQNNEYINQQIEKCNDKVRDGDYDGAITNARTLIETVCIHILDECNENYKEDGNLIKLYKSVSKVLNMSPSCYEDDAIKQICSGFFSIVGGLSGMRNNMSDAHGKGKNHRYKAAKRHAILAVNSAKTISEFILASWRENKGWKRC
ncbi:abortive infection family protein [Sedimentibacter sp. zth1]|uniref:abortive infection family protein n=1 Tax=Sedimentibacter sp. zth1 TaxID=2816908 RepID=UPI001A90F052|nr:abortive infection family protein [Sedimentibacter sp. zth1]QSX07247.1 abortive infection family protein [Sedimentibacter sp. zth1]